MALVSRRCCFHKVTGIDSVKSGPGIAFNMELDPLWCSGAAQAKTPVSCPHTQMELKAQLSPRDEEEKLTRLPAATEATVSHPRLAV